MAVKLGIGKIGKCNFLVLPKKDKCKLLWLRMLESSSAGGIISALGFESQDGIPASVNAPSTKRSRSARLVRAWLLPSSSITP